MKYGLWWTLFGLIVVYGIHFQREWADDACFALDKNHHFEIHEIQSRQTIDENKLLKRTMNTVAQKCLD